MGQAIVAIRPRGRYELFERSGLYDMYVAAQTPAAETSPCGGACGSCETRRCFEFQDLGCAFPIQMVDVDMAGNCVSLGFVDSTTLIPAITDYQGGLPRE